MAEQIVIKKNKPQKSKYKNLILGFGIIVITISGIYAYYQHAQLYPSTDDAYVNANLINVNSKLEGFIENVYVKNNQFVHKGDLLVAIDPLDYNIALNETENNVKLAIEEANIAHEKIKLSSADVDKAQSDYTFNSKMATRYTELFKENAGTQQDMQRYTNAMTQSEAQLKQTKLNLIQANNQYKSSLANVAISKAQMDSAKTRASYTFIRASVDGFVTDLNLTNGQLVMAGQNLFGLIDTSKWWVDTNFKETQITRIKPGQKALVKLDSYDHVYTGVVDSISRASGNTFSILPAQNATGNWVKVTQRFTVRINLQDQEKYPLRVGASADVTVDTR